MITLAFDTCLDKMYAVLKRDGNILASRIVENKDNKYHSAFLMSTLQEILSVNNIKPQDVNLIAVNVGPGSFTGIMAQQLNCKAVGVSSLEILAQIAPKNPLIALDARKNCAYLYCDGEIKGAVQLEDVQKIINSGDYTVITDNKLKPLLGGKSYQEEAYPLGEILADLAEKKDDEGNWRKLKPLYIQPPPGV